MMIPIPLMKDVQKEIWIVLWEESQPLLKFRYDGSLFPV